MGRSVETELPQARYSYGGDEYVFVELSEAMSLKVNFRAMAITNKLRDENIEGVTDICPSNASYMIRVDPDVLHPDDLISRLKEIDEEVGDVRGFELKTRVVDVPVMMEDPWTHETLMRFRDRDQDRVRAGATLVLPACPAGGASGGPQIRKAPHLHPRASLRLRRRLRGDLLGRGGGRLPTLRPFTGTGSGRAAE